MKTIIALIIALTACTTDNQQTLDEAREVIKAECGEAPLAPGWAVSFETVNGYDRAVLTREDWQRIDDYRDATATYAACVQGYAYN